MKPEIKSVVSSFLKELVIYSILVVAYFFLVLHFLGAWLYQLFQEQRTVYSFVALVLIIGQGIFLEKLTRILLRFIGTGRD